MTAPEEDRGEQPAASAAAEPAAASAAAEQPAASVAETEGSGASATEDDGDDDGELPIYVVRSLLKVRADSHLDSALVGELDAGCRVHVLARVTLPTGSTRAQVEQLVLPGDYMPWKRKKQK